jgi:hypothetical protein
MACLSANEALMHRAVLKRPLSVLKYAMTLDGKIATGGTAGVSEGSEVAAHSSSSSGSNSSSNSGSSRYAMTLDGKIATGGTAGVSEGV